MSTAHLELTDAIVAALQTAPALAGGRITRGRAVPMQLSAGTALFVRLANASGRPFTVKGDVIQWRTVVAVECAARASAAQDAHSAVDDLLQDVYARIATAPPADGSWQWDGEPEIHWQIDEADTTVGIAALILPIAHLTGPTLAPQT